MHILAFETLKSEITAIEPLATTNETLFYNRLDEWKKKFQSATTGDWSQLSKEQLLQVFEWESSYRPFQPHVFLTYFSRFRKQQTGS